MLLQNPNSDVLPLAPGGKVLVAGPNAQATVVMQGNYHGMAANMLPLDQHISAMNGAATLTSTSNGVSDACGKNASGIPAVVAATKGVNAVVLVLGGDCHEGEGTDRDFLHLPGVQSQLFKTVLAAATAAKQKLIVVLINGGPIAIDEIKGTQAAVIAAGFPGQAGGRAIAETLFGLSTISTESSRLNEIVKS